MKMKNGNLKRVENIMASEKCRVVSNRKLKKAA